LGGAESTKKGPRCKKKKILRVKLQKKTRFGRVQEGSAIEKKKITDGGSTPGLGPSRHRGPTETA